MGDDAWIGWYLIRTMDGQFVFDAREGNRPSFRDEGVCWESFELFRETMQRLADHPIAYEQRIQDTLQIDQAGKVCIKGGSAISDLFYFPSSQGISPP